MDLLVTGRVIDAAEAERYGILARVWPAADWDRELAAFVGELAEGPTRTYAAWKASVNRAVLGELDAYTDHERMLDLSLMGSEDTAEGVPRLPGAPPAPLHRPLSRCRGRRPELDAGRGRQDPSLPGGEHLGRRTGVDEPRVRHRRPRCGGDRGTAPSWRRGRRAACRGPRKRAARRWASRPAGPVPGSCARRWRRSRRRSRPVRRRPHLAARRRAPRCGPCRPSSAPATASRRVRPGAAGRSAKAARP